MNGIWILLAMALAYQGETFPPGPANLPQGNSNFPSAGAGLTNPYNGPGGFANRNTNGIADVIPDGDIKVGWRPEGNEQRLAMIIQIPPEKISKFAIGVNGQELDTLVPLPIRDRLGSVIIRVGVGPVEKTPSELQLSQMAPLNRDNRSYVATLGNQGPVSIDRSPAAGRETLLASGNGNGQLQGNPGYGAGGFGNNGLGTNPLNSNVNAMNTNSNSNFGTMANGAVLPEQNDLRGIPSDPSARLTSTPLSNTNDPAALNPGINPGIGNRNAGQDGFQGVGQRSSFSDRLLAARSNANNQFNANDPYASSNQGNMVLPGNNGLDRNGYDGVNRPLPSTVPNNNPQMPYGAPGAYVAQNPAPWPAPATGAIGQQPPPASPPAYASNLYGMNTQPNGYSYQVPLVASNPIASHSELANNQASQKLMESRAREAEFAAMGDAQRMSPQVLFFLFFSVVGNIYLFIWLGHLRSRYRSLLGSMRGLTPAEMDDD